MIYATECDHDHLVARIKTSWEKITTKVLEHYGINPKPITKIKFAVSKNEFFELWTQHGYLRPTENEKMSAHYMSAGCYLEPDTIAFCTENFVADMTDSRIDQLVAHEIGHRLETFKEIRKLKTKVKKRNKKIRKIIKKDAETWPAIIEGHLDRNAIKKATSPKEIFAECFAATVVHDPILSDIVKGN